MKRIIMMLVLAALFVMAMTAAAFPAAADTENLCQNHPEHKQCVTRNPGGVVNSPSCQPDRNPHCTTDRDNPSPNN